MTAAWNRDKTLLLLATWKQGRSKLFCRCQSNWLIIESLPLMLLLLSLLLLLLLLLWCCSTAVSVVPLPLMSLLMSLCCPSFYRFFRHSTVTPAVDLLLLYCRSAVAPLLFRYQSAIAPLLHHCRCCHCWCCSSYRSCCHSTAVAWIDIVRRLKRQNQGNGFHWEDYLFWMIGTIIGRVLL